MPYEGKKDTDGWFPVVLLDDTDGKTPETGVAFGDLTVDYSKVDGTDTWHSYTVATGDWHEKDDGSYDLRIGAVEFTAEAKYQVAVAAAVARTHRFVVEVKDKTAAEMQDDIDTILSRVTAAVATASALATHDGKLDTAQADLDLLAGTDGATLATSQPNYAPAKVNDEMMLADSAISSAKYDGTTAWGLGAVDSGATQIARTGADADTLETLSDEIALQATAAALTTHDGKLDTVDANVDLVLIDTGNIEADTQDLQTQIGTAGAGLSDLGGMSTAMQAEIEAEATDALVAIDLDHLSKVAAAPTPTIGSNLDKVMNKDGSQTFDPATDSLEAISDSGGGGLTAQQVRDAMKLAPTGGAPGVGSVDEHLDDILADTADIQPKIGTPPTSLAATQASILGDTGSLISGQGSIQSQITARTLLAADYFDPAADTVALVTQVDQLGTQAKADVEAEATAALVAYDPPTKAEMDTFETNITGEVNSVETTVDAVKITVDNIETQVGVAGAGLTDLGGMSATMKAQVEQEATDALVAYDPPTKAEMDTFETNITTEVNSVETAVDAVQITANNIETQVGVAGAGLTDLGGMSATMEAEVGDAVWDEDITTHTTADSAGKELQDKLDDADFVDYSFERNVLARHANLKPSSYEAGTGAHKVTVATTQDAGNTETESVV